MLATNNQNGALVNKAPSIVASTTFGPPSVLTATINDLEPGVVFEYYRGEYESLPDFSSLTPDLFGVINEISIDDKFEQEVTKDGLSVDGNFAVRFTGVLQIRDAGKYSFTVGSNDGAALFISGRTVTRNDGSHYYSEREGTKEFNSPGMYPITVLYFHKSGKLLEGVMTGPRLTIALAMIKEGIIFSSTETSFAIPSERLFHLPSKSPLSNKAHLSTIQSNDTLAKHDESPLESLHTALDEERAQSQIVRRTLASMMNNLHNSDEEIAEMSVVDIAERLQQDVVKLRRDYFFSIGLAFKLACKGVSHVDLQNAWESLPENMDHMHFGQFIKSQSESSHSCG